MSFTWSGAGSTLSLSRNLRPSGIWKHIKVRVMMAMVRLRCYISGGHQPLLHVTSLRKHFAKTQWHSMLLSVWLDSCVQHSCSAATHLQGPAERLLTADMEPMLEPEAAGDIPGDKAGHRGPKMQEREANGNQHPASYQAEHAIGRLEAAGHGMKRTNAQSTRSTMQVLMLC